MVEKELPRERNQTRPAPVKPGEKPASKNGTIEFKALSQGLGFHPFSDGMPYAPPTQAKSVVSRSTAGAGAMAAGKPTFAREIPRVVSPEFVRPEIFRNPATEPATISVPVAQPSVTLDRATPATKITPPRQGEVTYGFFYPVKRILAFLLDSVIHLTIGAVAVSAISSMENLRPQLLVSPAVITAAVLFLLCLNWALTTAQEVLFGTSLGKRTFGLYLQAPVTTLFLRAILFVFSVSLLGLGIIWALFDSRKRCWHDVASGVQPREIARL